MGPKWLLILKISDGEKLERGYRESCEIKEFQELKCGKVDILKRDKQEEHVTTLTRRGGKHIRMTYSLQIYFISVA